MMFFWGGVGEGGCIAIQNDVRDTFVSIARNVEFHVVCEQNICCLIALVLVFPSIN